jgi:hypothetical protein
LAGTPPSHFTLLGKDSPFFAMNEADNKSRDLAGYVIVNVTGKIWPVFTKERVVPPALSI